MGKRKHILFCSNPTGVIQLKVRLRNPWIIVWNLKYVSLVAANEKYKSYNLGKGWVVHDLQYTLVLSPRWCTTNGGQDLQDHYFLCETGDCELCTLIR